MGKMGKMGKMAAGNMRRRRVEMASMGIVRYLKLSDHGPCSHGLVHM